VAPPEPLVEEWREDGWRPFETLHVELLLHERARLDLGAEVVEGPAGPLVEWPDGWDAWSLVEHRRIVAEHFQAARDAAMNRAGEA